MKNASTEHLLSRHVLILNKQFLAIQVRTAEDAVSNLASGRGKVVDDNYIQYSLSEWVDFTTENRHNSDVAEKYEGIINSPSISIFVPQVLMMPECEYRTSVVKTVKYSRRNIYQRDDHTCQYCLKKLDRKQLNLDHVIPRSRGGTNQWTNIVTSCLPCNQKKGNKLLEELGWNLKHQPQRPKWKSHIGVPFSQNKKTYWKNFLA